MEARIARMESDVAHLQTDVGEIKVDLRALRDKVDDVDTRLSEKIDSLNTRLTNAVASAKLWGVTLIMTSTGVMLTIMARGFGWI